LKLNYGVTIELTPDEIENPIKISKMNPPTARTGINGDI